MLKRKIKSLLTPGYKKVLKQLAENQNQILNEISTIKANADFLQKSVDNVYEQTLSLDKCINTVFNYTSTIRDNIDYYQKINAAQASFSNTEYLASLFTDRSDKKILIAGFYGAYNLGDELMLQTLLSYIPEKLYSSVTVLLCHNQKYEQLNLPPVNFLHYPSSFLDYDFLAKNFDVLIWGGGALIDDTYYAGRFVNLLGNMIVDLSERFIQFNKKVVGIGLSTSKQLTHSKYIEKLKLISEKFDYFSVRDEFSANLLRGYGISNITYAPDIVYASPYWKSLQQTVTNGKVNCVGICLVCQNETLEVLNKLIDLVTEEFGENCKIKLIPFFHEDENDVAFYTNFVGNYNKSSENIVVCEYTNSFNDICEEIASTDIMINMRYHAMVISQMLGKPSLNIMFELSPHYFNKVTHIMNEFKTLENMVTMSDFEKYGFKELVSLKKPILRYDLYETSAKEIENVIRKYVR